MTHLKKIHQLQEKKLKLESELTTLIDKRNHDLAEIISTLNLDKISDEMIIGSIIDLQKKFQSKDKITEEWHKAGQQFLRKNPRKKLQSKTDLSKTKNKSSSNAA
jgi:hypothetical protein